MFQYGIRTSSGGITFDPEGILSTLGALATVLFGTLAGEALRTPRDRAQQGGILASAGTALWLLGLALRSAMPLNKQIYTPTFALWSTGLNLVVFAGLLWLIDIRRVRRGWTLPLIFGTNAILAFFLSQIITGLLIRWRTPAQRKAFYEVASSTLFSGWLPPRAASLAWAILIVLLNAALVYPLFRRRIFLRL